MVLSLLVAAAVAGGYPSLDALVSPDVKYDVCMDALGYYLPWEEYKTRWNTRFFNIRFDFASLKYGLTYEQKQETRVYCVLLQGVIVHRSSQR